MSNPEYTQDYVSPHIENWKKWLDEFKGNQTNMLELGVFEGRGTRWFLENILTHENSLITCVDTFFGGTDQHKYGVQCAGIYSRFRHNVESFDKVITYVSTTEKFLRENQMQFDLIYVDASHVAVDVLLDLILAWKVLKINGVMIADDYGWALDPDSFNRPGPAIDAFLKVYTDKYTLIAKDYQVALRKIA